MATSQGECDDQQYGFYTAVEDSKFIRGDFNDPRVNEDLKVCRRGDKIYLDFVVFTTQDDPFCSQVSVTWRCDGDLLLSFSDADTPQDSMCAPEYESGTEMGCLGIDPDSDQTWYRGTLVISGVTAHTGRISISGDLGSTGSSEMTTTLDLDEIHECA